MRYAHSLTAVNRKLKTGYAFTAPPGWRLKESGFNGQGHAEVTITRVGPYVPEPLDLPDGWEVAGWFRHPIDGAAGEAPSPAAVRRLVHTMFWIGWTAGSLATMALYALFWLVWG